MVTASDFFLSPCMPALLQCDFVPLPDEQEGLFFYALNLGLVEV